MALELRKSFLFLFAFFVLGPCSLSAQTIFGSLTGDVVDSSHTGVPGAAITVRNLGTGVERHDTTDASGFWRIPSLPPGQYAVSAEAKGFAKEVQSPVIVDAAIERKLEFSMRVSSQTTTVSVTGQSPVIEATKSQLSDTVHSEAILELPTTGNTTILAELMAGVAQNNPGVCCSLYAVNSSSERSDHYTIDNATNNDPGSTGAYIQLPAEDIQEYHLITNNYSAEFGRNSGSVAQFITKSGTNRFHGIETWTYNGPSLNAFMTSEKRAYNSYIAAGYTPHLAERSARAGFEDNTMLFSLGGPIQHDKMFFFASYDESISATSAEPTTTAFTAPGLAALQANQASFAPGVVSFLQQTYPVANTPTSEGSLTVTLPNGNPLTVPLGLYNAGLTGSIGYKPTPHRGLGKLDRKLSDNDTLSLRYLTYEYDELGAPNALPINREGGRLHDQSAALNEVHVFNPGLVAETRLDYVRYWSYSIGNFTIGSENIGGSGLATIGYSNQPQGRTGDIYEAGETMSWIKGDHTMRFGGSYLGYKDYSIYAPYAYGYVTYPSFQNLLYDQNASYTGFGGNGYLSCLDNEISLFFGDDWRVKSDLTLNLGIRWEYESAPNKYFSGATPDPHEFSPHLGFAYSPHISNGLLGRLLGNGKTAIRRGFGLSYDNIFQTIIVETARNYPRGLAVTLPAVSGKGYFDFLYNRSVLPPPVSPAQFTGNPELLNDFVFSPNHQIVSPYANQYNFGIERELAEGTVLKVFYVGTHGVHLLRTYEGNLGIFQSAVQADPSTYTTVLPSLTLTTDPASGLPAYKQNPNAGPVDVVDSIGYSDYNSLQVTLAKRLWKGFQLEANYTWSAFINDGDGEDSQNYRGYESIPWDRENDKARSALDQPQRLVIQSLYHLPDFAAGSAFSRATGGWELGGIYTYGSGTPYNIWNGYDALGILADPFATYSIGGISNAQRPSYNPSGVPGTGSSSALANPMYVANLTNSGVIGNLGANTGRLGATSNLNLQILKDIRLYKESTRAELFCSMSDTLNHRNFTATPANIVTSSTNNTTFMNLGYTTVPGGVITLGGRIIF